MNQGAGKKARRGVLLGIFLVLLLGGALFYFWKSGFLSGSRALKGTFESDVAVFKSGDSAKIRKIVYGEDGPISDEDNLLEFFLKNASYSFKDSGEDYIEVDINSKDMGGFLEVLLDKMFDLEDDKGILDMVEAYYPDQKNFSKTVKLSYDKDESGAYHIDYSNFDFKDAVYGGFLSSYLDFRDNFIKELSKESEGDE